MKLSATQTELLQFLYQKQNTSHVIKGVDAQTIAQQLNYDRANTSRNLNSLCRDNLAVKVSGRPTLFYSMKGLKEKIPNTYIPSTFTSQDLFDSFLDLKLRIEPARKNETLLIGIETGETLQASYDACIESIEYPPAGLNIYIKGPIGVGKLHFVKAVFLNLLDKGVFTDDSDLIVINTSQITGSFYSYLDRILYNATHRKLIVINGIERLDPQFHFELIELLSSKLNHIENHLETYRKHTYIIIGNEGNENYVSLEIGSLFPTKINISPFDSKTNREKTLFVLKYFYDEARLLEKTFQLQKNTVQTLINAPYRHNLVQLRSEIKSIVLDSTNKQKANHEFHITNNNIPTELFDRIDFTSVTNKLDKLFEQLPFENIIINPNESFGKIERLFPNRYEPTQTHHSVKLSIYCKNLLLFQDKVSQQLLDTNETQFINTVITNAFEESKLEFEDYISIISKELESIIFKDKQKLRQIEYVPDFIIEDPLLISTSENICSLLKKRYDLEEDLTHSIRHFLQHFIYMVSSVTFHSLVQVLLVSKDVNVNNSLEYYFISLKKRNPEIQDTLHTIYQEFNYNNNNQFFNQIIEKCDQIDQGKGVIILFSDEFSGQFIERFKYNTPRKNIYVERLLYNKLYEYLTKSSNPNHFLNDVLQLNTNSFSTSEEELFNIKRTILDATFIPDLVFINPFKALNASTDAFFNIIFDLSLNFVESLYVKFVVHLGFTLERVKIGDTLKFNNVSQFEQENLKTFLIIEKHLSPLLSEFHLDRFPKSEVAYITQIINEYLGFL